MKQMKLLFLIIFTLPFIISNSVLSQNVKIIKCGTLVNVTNSKLESNMDILIEENKIKQIGKDLLIPTNAVVIDLSKFTVLPGLIDAHVHLLLQGDSTDVAYEEQILKESIPYRTIRATVAARKALMTGFTSLRDVGNEGTYYADVDLKKAIENGIIIGPRLQVSTRAMSITGAYPINDFSWELKWPKGVWIVDGVENCRQAVREMIGHGADWIKVYCDRSYYIDTDGGISSKPNFTLDELNAIVDEAHRQGVKVAAHAIGRNGIKNALDAGVNSIEHGDGFDDQLIGQALKQGAYWCPTMLVTEYVAGPRTRAGNKFWSDMVSHLYAAFSKGVKAGMKIALGTDAGGYPWMTMNNAQELSIMVKHGMSSWQAIRAATFVPAELMDWQDKVGSIEAGKLADIVAVDGNPVDDVSILEHIGFVMKDGGIIKDELSQ